MSEEVMTKILIDRVTAKQALEALKEFGYHGSSPRWERTANALTAALEQQQAEPVQEPVVFYRCKGCSHAYEGEAPSSCDCMDDTGFERVEYFTTPPLPVQEPVAMRMPKVGDRIVCLEDESFGTVVSLTAGGSPDILFDDGSRGTYMVREFAELFGYVAPPLPVQEDAFEGWVKIDEVRKHFDSVNCGTIYKHGGEGRVLLRATPPKREWVGLTDEEVQFCALKHRQLVNAYYDAAKDTNVITAAFEATVFYKEIEAVLKERNG
tara:strand:- start:443 stop:1237 length:795 start_codon:yes stop_codon:yes gene_type:complete